MVNQTDKKKSILAVDNEPKNNEIITRYLTENGYDVTTTLDPTLALEIIKHKTFDLIITNFNLAPISGLDLIRHIKENYKKIPIIVLTEHINVTDAVQAIKMGACKYIEIPLSELDLTCVVESSFSKIKIIDAMPPGQFKSFQKILGNSTAMHQVFTTIKKASTTQTTILITGESGTGKELVARTIHYSNEEITAPFVPVNCGAIPDNLLESELFGYVKGAFTGANDSRDGFFQTANNGSIFLDEISETPMSMQVKLLRVLQEKQFYKVGSRVPNDVSVRIIAATNANIESLISQKLFREDLYYRLNVIYIHLPPLRDRGDDIILLKRYFLNKYAIEYNKETPTFSEEATAAFLNYSWPGNIRELQNIVQRLVVMGDGNEIDISDLPPAFRFIAKSSSDHFTTLESNEKEFIHRVLASTNYNKTLAAKILGIDRKTLREKIKPTLL